MTHPPPDSSPSQPPRHSRPHPPAPRSSPSYPTYPTYPWQPLTPPPAPVPPPPRRSPDPGRHGDLRRLRSAYRWQRRVATLTALGYFALFLVLSAFAPALMTHAVSGGLTTGLLAGLAQLPVMCLAVALYETTARRRVDRLAARLRTRAELEARRG
ncbi:DUF485 domain-containing protein [Streptomyces sp. PmtG]